MPSDTRRQLDEKIDLWAMKVVRNVYWRGAQEFAIVRQHRAAEHAKQVGSLFKAIHVILDDYLDPTPIRGEHPQAFDVRLSCRDPRTTSVKETLRQIEATIQDVLARTQQRMGGKKSRGHPRSPHYEELNPLIEHICRTTGCKRAAAIQYVAERVCDTWMLITRHGRAVAAAADPFPKIKELETSGLTKEQAVDRTLNEIQVAWCTPEVWTTALPMSLLARLPALNRAQLRELWGGELRPSATREERVAAIQHRLDIASRRRRKSTPKR